MSTSVPHSIPRFLVDRARREPDATLCVVPAELQEALPGGQPHPEHPGWWTVRVAEAVEQVAGLTEALVQLGVQQGDRVAIAADTSHLWAAVDLAVLSLGAITVGLYPNLPAERLAAQIAHCGARLVILQHEALAQRLRPHLPGPPPLLRVLYGSGSTPALRPEPSPVAAWEARVQAIDPGLPATIVYTSGTTGASKGAVLTHAAFHHVVHHSRDAFPTRPGDRSVVFLPMAHVLQRFATYRGLVDGVEGWYAPDIPRLPETIQRARPHVLIAVPRVLEKIRLEARSQADRRGAGPLFDWATRTAQAPRSGSWRSRARYEVADRLVLRRIRRGLGDELRVLVSGSAPLDPALAQWFEAAGIPVREGWGLTETCAPATAEPLDRPRPGSVGLPLPGTRVRTAEDGELEVHSPALFVHYHNDPDATRTAFTPDGWFRTGDLGRVDADGYVWITGRKKELIITSGGRNIAPAPIEAAISAEGVGQVVVLGDRRPYLVALFFPDADHPRPCPTESIRAAIEAWNRSQPRPHRVVRWAWVPTPLTVEAGTLTPTLKARRSTIATTFAREVAQLYAG